MVLLGADHHGNVPFVPTLPTHQFIVVHLWKHFNIRQDLAVLVQLLPPARQECPPRGVGIEEHLLPFQSQGQRFASLFGRIAVEGMDRLLQTDPILGGQNLEVVEQRGKPQKGAAKLRSLGVSAMHGHRGPVALLGP